MTDGWMDGCGRSYVALTAPDCVDEPYGRYGVSMCVSMRTMRTMSKSPRYLSELHSSVLTSLRVVSGRPAARRLLVLSHTVPLPTTCRLRAYTVAHTSTHPARYKCTHSQQNCTATDIGHADHSQPSPHTSTVTSPCPVQPAMK